MAYLSLYRKWRPQSFEDVTGQQHIVKTLENSLRTGRVAHAYLFTGPRGTGKTSIARLMAKGLNCSNGPTPEPCDSCNECVSIRTGNSLNVIEIDGASNRGIEEIRELREQVRYAPIDARYKVYIIDEVHMLTTEAFNALLKTLEEPPSHAIFVFATTDPHKVPPTILSRCQRYDFKRFSMDELCARLNHVLTGEEVTAESGVVEVIAEHAEGGMRDALGLLDQCLAFSSNLTIAVVTEVLGIVSSHEIEDFVSFIQERDAHKALKKVNEIYDSGKDLLQFTRDVLQFLRKALASSSSDNSSILQTIKCLSECLRDMRYASDQKIPLEMAIIEIVGVAREIDILNQRISDLETKLSSLGTQTQPTSMGEANQSGSENASRLKMSDGDETKLGKIRDNWEDYLMMLRNERYIQPEAFLREGIPFALHGDTLVLAFPKERGFHKASIEQDKHKEPSERVLSKFFGTTLKLSCVFHENTVPPENKTPKEKSKAKARKVNVPSQETQSPELETAQDQGNQEMDETVAAALKLFGGKIIKVKDNK